MEKEIGNYHLKLIGDKRLDFIEQI